jgi:hypothetical protein
MFVRGPKSSDFTAISAGSIETSFSMLKDALLVRIASFIILLNAQRSAKEGIDWL